MRKRGFTLIELLIVVAIIAIVALIALPNFLEAQIRSKVSRTKTDLRTIATALESYFVNTNTYPPDFQFGVLSYLERLKHLTTPIAYMSSVPEDPFADAGTILKHFLGSPYGNPYMIPAIGGEIKRPFTYDYAFRRQPDGSYEPYNVWAKISMTPWGVMWGMRGIGPDKIPTVLGDPNAMPYDPTNGTVSFGDIFWTGPGVGEDQPRRQ